MRYHYTSRCNCTTSRSKRTTQIFTKSLPYLWFIKTTVYYYIAVVSLPKSWPFIEKKDIPSPAWWPQTLHLTALPTCNLISKGITHCYLPNRVCPFQLPLDNINQYLSLSLLGAQESPKKATADRCTQGLWQVLIHKQFGLTLLHSSPFTLKVCNSKPVGQFDL